MKRKKNLFVWLFIFTFLSTISLNFLNERNFSTFSIEKINITGIVNLNEADFQNQLNRFYGKSLIFLNRKDLNEIGSKFVFINEIKIKKSYPNTLNIKVKENKPLGILFDNSEKILLLENDKIVNNSLLIDNKNLFKIKGKGAKKKFSGFYQRLNNTSFEIELLKELNYFEVDRWDIVLKDGKILKLPTESFEASIEKFMSIYDKDNFSNFKIFDFRINGQLILK
tara:strand:- start:1019 stop:1693 length:675 start_codon:yes stop_codon:yes gene_type:complete